MFERNLSESSMGSLRLSLSLSPPRNLRNLSSLSSGSESTISVPMRINMTESDVFKTKPKPKTANPCCFYTIDHVIPFLVAHIVKDSNNVAEMLTLETGDKNLTFISFDNKCTGEWKQTLKLATAIYERNKMAVVPINIICGSNAHLNILIFNPEKRTVERYEPHGLESPSDCAGANTTLDDELKSKLSHLLPGAQYIPRADTNINGFQTWEEKATEHKDEWGFCATWSTLYAQERLRRPKVSAQYAIRQMRSKFGTDPTKLRNIVRRESSVLKKNIGFNFDRYMNDIFYTPKGKLKSRPGKTGNDALKRLDSTVYTKFITSLFPAPKSKQSLIGTLSGLPSTQHDKVAKAWDRDKRWNKNVKLDVLKSKFDAQCNIAFAENTRIELEEEKGIWKLTNPKNLKTKQFPDMGLGVYTSKAIKGEVLVLTETGITGKRDGLRLPAALLVSKTKLSFHGDSPDSFSPFPEYTLKQWNTARLMVSSNAFTVNSNRVLFEFSSRLNHSCNPNLVRQHKGEKMNLISTRNIKAGEQLTIQYNPKAGHEDISHFKCNCGRSLVERTKIFNNNFEIMEDWSKE